mmetsp:Transcript_105763/g.341173  ORF Transcript_105763/g.341173 Transcript_105763/m.341173 type:complete len:209 (-) Transcript_105763:53-679(-)
MNPILRVLRATLALPGQHLLCFKVLPAQMHAHANAPACSGHSRAVNIGDFIHENRASAASLGASTLRLRGTLWRRSKCVSANVPFGAKLCSHRRSASGEAARSGDGKPFLKTDGGGEQDGEQARNRGRWRGGNHGPDRLTASKIMLCHRRCTENGGVRSAAAGMLAITGASSNATRRCNEAAATCTKRYIRARRQQGPSCTPGLLCPK